VVDDEEEEDEDKKEQGVMLDKVLRLDKTWKRDAEAESLIDFDFAVVQLFLVYCNILFI